MPSKYDGFLIDEMNKITQEFTSKHTARETGLQISRLVIRLSANAIRAVHRKDFDKAQVLIKEAKDKLKEGKIILTEWPEIYYSGFMSDARKEFSEACITLGIISDTGIPDAQNIGVEMAPYLNGMAETVGELRRFILDSLRQNDISSCEEFMETMDDIYNLLVTIDFPEGVTGGLRRSTDLVRGILERTRGDLTMALRQRSLEDKLGKWENRLSPDQV